MPERAYIVVLTWNNYKDTIVCLQSVLRSSYPDFRVVLIDNGSTDRSCEEIKEWAESERLEFSEYDEKTAETGGTGSDKPLVIIRNFRDYGVPGNNSGLKYVTARGDGAYIWLLNNDTVVDKDALSEMISLARSDASIGVVGSKLIYYHAPGVLQAAGGGRLLPALGNAVHLGCGQKDEGQWDAPYKPDFVTGASMLMKKKTLQDVGYFDMNYFLLWEDIDMNVRAKRKGYEIMYCPKGRVIHKEGGTAGRISPIMDYYWVRNGLYFTRKFYPFFLPLVFFSYFVKHTAVRVLRRQPMNFGSYVKGALAFLAGKTGE